MLENNDSCANFAPRGPRLAVSTAVSNYETPRSVPRVDNRERRPYVPPPVFSGFAMKVVNSLKSMKGRHKNCRIVRRKGRVYVINKTNPRFKARQG